MKFTSQIWLNMVEGGQPHTHTLPHSSHYHSPRFFAFFLPRRSMLSLAGDLAQLHLPVGVKKVDLSGTEVTGRANV